MRIVFCDEIAPRGRYLEARYERSGSQEEDRGDAHRPDGLASTDEDEPVQERDEAGRRLCAVSRGFRSLTWLAERRRASRLFRARVSSGGRGPSRGALIGPCAAGRVSHGSRTLLGDMARRNNARRNNCRNERAAMTSLGLPERGADRLLRGAECGSARSLSGASHWGGEPQGAGVAEGAELGGTGTPSGPTLGGTASHLSGYTWTTSLSRST